jgi:hypothetical protein
MIFINYTRMFSVVSVVFLTLLAGLSWADESRTLNNQLGWKKPDGSLITTENSADIKRQIGYWQLRIKLLLE